MSSPNELSFLPDDYLAKKARRRANIFCGALSAVIASVIGAAFTVTEKSMQELDRRYADVERQYTDAARKIEQVKKMHAQQRRVVQHAELAASLVERVPRSNLLAELTNSLPTGVSLVDFSMSSIPHQDTPAQYRSAFEMRQMQIAAQHRADEAGPKPALVDVKMKLSGLAETDVQVAQFISRLNRSTIFADVNLLISEGITEQNENLRRFQIEMTLNPMAEVKEDPSKVTKTAAVELPVK